MIEGWEMEGNCVLTFTLKSGILSLALMSGIDNVVSLDFRVSIISLENRDVLCGFGLWKFSSSLFLKAPVGLISLITGVTIFFLSSSLPEFFIEGPQI